MFSELKSIIMPSHSFSAVVQNVIEMKNPVGNVIFPFNAITGT